MAPPASLVTDLLCITFGVVMLPQRQDLSEIQAIAHLFLFPPLEQCLANALLTPVSANPWRSQLLPQAVITVATV